MMRQCKTRSRTILILPGLTLTWIWLGFFVFSPLNSSAGDLAPPVLPVPNGYEEVLLASKEMEKLTPVVNGSLPDADTLDTPALREYVEKNSGALALVRFGLDRPFQVPFVYDSIEAMNPAVKESGILRMMAGRVLYAEGVLARRDKRFADSMRSFIDLLRLGDAMSRNVPMILYMASLAPQSLGINGLRDLRGDLDAAQLRALIDTLKKLDSGREPANEVIRRENAFIDQNVRKMGALQATVLIANGFVKSTKKQVESQLEQSSRKVEVRYRLLLADLVVKLSFKENGKYPDTISTPSDPYSPTNAQFIYRLTKSGYQLYSVGPDGDDDRLDPVLGKRYIETSNGDLTLDSL